MQNKIKINISEKHRGKESQFETLKMFKTLLLKDVGR